MSRLDMDLEDFAQLLHHVANDINFAIGVRSLNNCNTCGKKDCKYRPKPGENVRINCALWRDKYETSK